MTRPDSTRPRASLIVAHGSRVEAANEAHVTRCRALDDRIERITIRPAFLEMARPDVPTALDELVAAGHLDVAVQPFFLHGGRHTMVDLPELLDDARRRHPDVAFALGDHIGGRPELDEMLVGIIENERA